MAEQITPKVDVTPKEPASKDYLGDSVYADFDGYAITLTTENGNGASNTIVLEPEVMSSLVRYRDRVTGG